MPRRRHAGPAAARPSAVAAGVAGMTTAVLVGALLVSCRTAPGPGSAEAGASPAVSATAPAGDQAVPRSRTRAAGSSAFEPGRADRAAVVALLDERAAAVRRGDRAAFLAVADDRSAALVTQQRDLFDNLTRFRPDDVSWSLGRDVLVPDEVVAASAGEPTLRYAAAEHVRLDGTFSAPVGNPVRLTFVRRDDGWRLGRERPATTTGTVAGADGAQPRPWFGDPVQVARQGDLVVVADAGRAGRADLLVTEVEAALRHDADLLGLPVDDRLLVDASSNGRAVRMNTLDATEAAAVYGTVVDVGADGRPVRVAGGAVRVNPGLGPDRLSRDPGLLRHELGHFLLREFAGSAPLWVSEGIAEHLRWSPLTTADLRVPDGLWRRVQRAERTLPSSGLFSLDPQVNYLVAQAAVQRLLDRGGMARFRTLLERYEAVDAGVPGDAATARLLRSVYGLTPRELADLAWDDLADLQR